jgi:hypothetical protein
MSISQVGGQMARRVCGGRADLTVGAGLLAMDVNDYAYFLNVRGASEFIASKLAPTGFFGV